MEERLPFAYISFPEWFERRYPEAVENVHLNARRLTSPYDLYETLKDLLHPLKRLNPQELLKRRPSSKLSLKNNLKLQTNYSSLRYFNVDKNTNITNKNKQTEIYFTDTGVCKNKTNLSPEMKLHCDFKRQVRGISLFLPIPTDRTCNDAGIPLHYCTCQVQYMIYL